MADVYGKIRDWSAGKVHALRYEDLLRTIVHFATQGDLQLSDPAGVSEIDKCRSAQMAFMLAESGT